MPSRFRKFLAAKSRKRTARGSRKEEELEVEFEEDNKPAGAALHLVVSAWTEKQGYRYDAFSCYDEKWSRQSSSSYTRFPFPNSTHRLLGRCNGLLCLEFHSTHPIFANGAGAKCAVWEPSTNTLQLIPQPSSMNRPCDCDYPSKQDCFTNVVTEGGGLFFDSQSGDYKFFSFTLNYYEHRDDDWGLFTSSEHAQVYSVKNNVWKELSYPLYQGNEIVGKGKGICVNGVCYWTANCLNSCCILSFNLVTEEFSTIEYPLFKNEASSLVEMDGSLCLLLYPKNFEEDDRKGVISLMVYSPSPSSSSSSSWSRVEDSGFDVVGYHKPVWFGKRNDSCYHLLLQGPQGDLLEYDYTRKVVNLIHKSKHNPRSLHAFAYETKTTKNNANIWHSSSFHQLQLQKRFAVYARECDQRGGDDY